MGHFIIVGTQRTGSSVIAETLGLHPFIACGWEWTVGVAPHKKIQVAERGLSFDFSELDREDRVHMATTYTGRESWLGFRWLFSASGRWIIHPRFSPALWADRLERFVKWVSGRPDTHIIHVVREDNVEWLKSIYLAKSSNLYSKERYPDDLRICIPESEAVYRVRAKRWIDGRLGSLNRTNPFLRIKYEDFVQNQNDEISAALKFLGCSYEELNVCDRTLEKQSRGTSVDYVINYGEVVTRLRERNLLRA